MAVLYRARKSLKLKYATPHNIIYGGLPITESALWGVDAYKPSQLRPPLTDLRPCVIFCAGDWKIGSVD